MTKKRKIYKIDFDGYGIELKSREKLKDTVILSYESEIGKKDFSFEIAKKK